MKTIANCPRRIIYNTPDGVKIVCKPMPIRVDLPFEDLVAHPELYTTRHVTQEDCELCLGRKLPNLATQIASYAQALVGWTKAVFPVRTDAEVEEIFGICKQCDALVDGKCTECLCTINLTNPAIKNKLKMKTTTCKRGLWPT